MARKTTWKPFCKLSATSSLTRWRVCTTFQALLDRKCYLYRKALGVLGDGLEGNFWEEGLSPCIQSQLECLHGWSVQNRLWQFGTTSSTALLDRWTHIDNKLCFQFLVFVSLPWMYLACNLQSLELTFSGYVGQEVLFSFLAYLWKHKEVISCIFGQL